jgi:hypothetical protein
MRLPVVCAWLTCAVIAARSGAAAARPTVAVAGIEAAGDDAAGVGVARDLSRALRQAAGAADRPLQLIDPMVIADDVEALVWGKLIRDGETWVATVHLSAVGSDGDTVSYRAVIEAARPAPDELTTWGKVIYDALLEQIDLDEGAGAGAAAAAGTNGATGATEDPFTTRVPPEIDETVLLDAPPAIGSGRMPPDPHASTRRLFWISTGLTAAAGLFWIYAAVQIDDAEDQLDNLAGCTGCDRAVQAANDQGSRWEGISWLAGTATVAGTIAAVLFGYQGYVVGRRPAASELVGRRATPAPAFSVAPVIGADRIGAGMTVAF